MSEFCEIQVDKSFTDSYLILCSKKERVWSNLAVFDRPAYLARVNDTLRNRLGVLNKMTKAIALSAVLGLSALGFACGAPAANTTANNANHNTNASNTNAANTNSAASNTNAAASNSNAAASNSNAAHSNTTANSAANSNAKAEPANAAANKAGDKKAEEKK